MKSTEGPAHPSQIAVVTGGAGGIGRSIVQELLNSGCDVAIGDIDPAVGERFISELGNVGTRVVSRRLDVTSADSVSEFFDTIEQALGIPTILVNGAGAISIRPLENIDLNEWQRMIDINLTGTFLCTQRMLRNFPKNADGEYRWGRVVNIASQSGKVGSANAAHYCAAKFGVIGFTQSVAMEMASYGVTVNAICPTMVDTDMMTTVLRGHAELGGPTPDEQIRQLHEIIPVGRLAKPKDIATAVTFLCDENSSFITGQALNITGGAWMG